MLRGPEEEEFMVLEGLVPSEEVEPQQGGASGVTASWKIKLEKEVSTLDGPIWSRCSIAPTYPSRSHFPRKLNR